MQYITRSGDEFRFDGKRFQFVGFNFYSFIVESTSIASMEAIFAGAQRHGVRVFRTWCFDPGDPPSNSGSNFRYLSGSSLLWRESTFVKLDTLLDMASKYGIKMILSLADNPTYNTKKTYVNWANSVYSSGLSTSYPYVGFFDSNDCRNIFKEFIYKLINRTNTINGKLYRDDDAIMTWELGNELRYDVFDAESGTQNTINSVNIGRVSSWIQDISAYIKSLDTNHLVAFSSCSHTWQWVNGDTISNGSGYGVDYNLFAEIDDIDYLDFHVYPTQGGDGSQLQKYGQRLGYANAITGDGFRAQLVDFVDSAKNNGKPCVIGEIGFVKEVVGSTTYFPLYPRHEAFREIFRVFFDADGDGVLLWSATNTSGGAYSLVLNEWNGSYTNANSDDRTLMGIIARRNAAGKRIAANSDD